MSILVRAFVSTYGAGPTTLMMRPFLTTPVLTMGFAALMAVALMGAVFKSRAVGWMRWMRPLLITPVFFMGFAACIAVVFVGLVFVARAMAADKGGRHGNV